MLFLTNSLQLIESHNWVAQIPLHTSYRKIIGDQIQLSRNNSHYRPRAIKLIASIRQSLVKLDITQT